MLYCAALWSSWLAQLPQMRSIDPGKVFEFEPSSGFHISMGASGPSGTVCLPVCSWAPGPGLEETGGKRNRWALLRSAETLVSPLVVPSESRRRRRRRRRKRKGEGLSFPPPPCFHFSFQCWSSMRLRTFASCDWQPRGLRSNWPAPLVIGGSEEMLAPVHRPSAMLDDILFSGVVVSLRIGWLGWAVFYQLG